MGTEYEFINVDGMKFELLSADKKKKRVFIAPNNNEQIKWLKAIKAQTKLQDLHFYAKQAEEELDILWNDSDKIWEYYWVSDGCHDKFIHRGFTCKQMYEPTRHILSRLMSQSCTNGLRAKYG